MKRSGVYFTVHKKA